MFIQGPIKVPLGDETCIKSILSQDLIFPDVHFEPYSYAYKESRFSVYIKRFQHWKNKYMVPTI